MVGAGRAQAARHQSCQVLGLQQRDRAMPGSHALYPFNHRLHLFSPQHSTIKRKEKKGMLVCVPPELQLATGVQIRHHLTRSDPLDVLDSRANPSVNPNINTTLRFETIWMEGAGRDAASPRPPTTAKNAGCSCSSWAGHQLPLFHPRTAQGFIECEEGNGRERGNTSRWLLHTHSRFHRSSYRRVPVNSAALAIDAILIYS